MAVNLCIPTIRHTGTRFLTQSLLPGYGPYDVVRRMPADAKRPWYVVGHVHAPSLETLLDFMPKLPVVVPMRHPCSVWKSWRVRGMEFDFFCDHWDNLMEYVMPFKPTVIHVDMAAHNGYDELEKLIQLPLNRKAEPVSDKGNYDHCVTLKELGRMPKYIMDFYNSLL